MYTLLKLFPPELLSRICTVFAQESGKAVTGATTLGALHLSLAQIDRIQRSLDLAGAYIPDADWTISGRTLAELADRSEGHPIAFDPVPIEERLYEVLSALGPMGGGQIELATTIEQTGVNPLLLAPNLNPRFASEGVRLTVAEAANCASVGDLYQRYDWLIGEKTYWEDQ